MPKSKAKENFSIPDNYGFSDFEYWYELEQWLADRPHYKVINIQLVSEPITPHCANDHYFKVFYKKEG